MNRYTLIVDGNYFLHKTLFISGKIKRKHAFKNHILTKKGTKQKRNLTQAGLVHKADANNVKFMLQI